MLYELRYLSPCKSILTALNYSVTCRNWTPTLPSLLERRRRMHSLVNQYEQNNSLPTARPLERVHWLPAATDTTISKTECTLESQKLEAR